MYYLSIVVDTIRYRWTSDADEHVLEMVRIEGTNGRPYHFGDGDQARFVEVQEFWLATVTVTQALWLHVMGGRRFWLWAV